MSTELRSNSDLHHGLLKNDLDSSQPGDRKRNCYKGIYDPYSIFASLIFLGFLAVSLGYTLSSKEHRYASAIKCGTILGLVSSLFVIIYYLRFPKIRSHSNTMLFWRSVCDCGLSCLFLYYAVQSSSNGISWQSLPDQLLDSQGDPTQMCVSLAMLYQFFTFSSEAWLGCVSWDLWATLGNPFTDYKANMRLYHFVSWSTAIVMAAFVSIPSVPGIWYVGGKEVDHYPICYLKNESSAFFDAKVTLVHMALCYLPIAAIYLYTLAAFLRTYDRFAQGGISETFEKRLHILAANAINILVYLLYWTFWGVPYCLTYLIQSCTGHERSPQVMAMYWITSFVLPCKGFADLLVFIFSNDLSDPFESRSAMNDHLVDPQMNTALRDEVLYFVTTGIRYSVKTESSREEDVRTLFLDSRNDKFLHGIRFKEFLDMIFQLIFNERYIEMQVRNSFDRQGPRFESLNEARRNRAVLEEFRSSFLDAAKSMQENTDVEDGERLPAEDRPSDKDEGQPSVDRQSGSVISQIEDPSQFIKQHSSSTDGASSLTFYLTAPPSGSKIDFIDFKPGVFDRIRSLFRINREAYFQAWTAAAKVKLNEGGASNAFFIFSGDERFIAKSCTREEMLVLRSIADDYEQYILKNPGSFLVRIVGAHCLKMYNSEFFFFVMENLFKMEANANRNQGLEKSDDVSTASPPDGSPLSPGGGQREELRRSLSNASGESKLAEGSTASVGPSLQERYDIKGSWVNRNAKPPTHGQKVTCRYCNQKYRYRRRQFRAVRSSSYGSVELDRCAERLDGHHVPNIVLKDNDLNYRLCLDGEVAEGTAEQLGRDALFLARHGIMDYSVLIGVHNERHRLQSQIGTPRRMSTLYAPTLVQPAVSQDRNMPPAPGMERMVSSPALLSSTRRPAHVPSSSLQSDVCRRDATHIVGPSVYYLGIIDILQRWTWRKRVERLFKIYVKNEEADGLSAVEPRSYFLRFVRKVYDMMAVELSGAQLEIWEAYVRVRQTSRQNSERE